MPVPAVRASVVEVDLTINPFQTEDPGGRAVEHRGRQYHIKNHGKWVCGRQWRQVLS